LRRCLNSVLFLYLAWRDRWGLPSAAPGVRFLFVFGMLSIAFAVLSFQLAPHVLSASPDTRVSAAACMTADPDSLPALSRRAALVSSLVLLSGGSGASAATLADVVTELDKQTPKEERNVKGAPEKHTPAVVVTPGSMSAKTVMFSVPHVMDAKQPHFIEYMWIKKYTPKAPAGYVKLVASQKFTATDASPPTLTKMLPPGEYVPLLYCNLHGLWEGQPFTV